MPILAIDEIAREIFNKSQSQKKEEKIPFVKNDDYSAQKALAFYRQFREEFRKMYLKTLTNLKINERKKPTLASLVKDDLLNVLSEEIENVTINPSTHKLDFSAFQKQY